MKIGIMNKREKQMRNIGIGGKNNEKETMVL